MSGQPGVPALPPALTEQCSVQESVTALLTEAQSAEETGAKPATASSETAQVGPHFIAVDNSFGNS